MFNQANHSLILCQENKPPLALRCILFIFSLFIIMALSLTDAQAQLSPVDIDGDSMINEQDLELIQEIESALDFLLNEPEITAAAVDINGEIELDGVDYAILCDFLVKPNFDVNGDCNLNAEDIEALQKILNTSENGNLSPTSQMQYSTQQSIESGQTLIINNIPE